MQKKTAQKDNSTLLRKVALRLSALDELGVAPIIMETHGGFGQIFERCYAGFKSGIVFETDSRKTAVLGLQRPTWSVYESDCVAAIAEGAGAHLLVNFLDLDPYGEPWPVLDAFFSSNRPWPARLVVVANHGLRQKLQMNNGSR